MSGERRERSTGREPGLFGYCLMTGMSGVAVGAGVSLLGGSLWVRLTMWLGVLVVLAAVAGWWWARSPATARHWTVDLLVRPATRDARSQRV
jgi:hypothetical protein